MSKKIYNITKIKPEHSNHFIKENLDLAKPGTESESTYYEPTKTFEVKIPLPNDKFKPDNVFLINKIIWIFISDNSTTSARNGRKKDYIMTLSFTLSDVLTPEGDELIIPENKEINAVIYNDNRINIKWKKSSITYKKYVKESLFILPDDTGGGVIIKFP